MIEAATTREAVDDRMRRWSPQKALRASATTLAAATLPRALELRY